MGAAGENALDLGILETSTLTVKTIINNRGRLLCPSTAGWDTSGHLIGGGAGSNAPSVIYVEP